MASPHQAPWCGLSAIHLDNNNKADAIFLTFYGCRFYQAMNRKPRLKTGERENSARLPVIVWLIHVLSRYFRVVSKSQQLMWPVSGDIGL